MKSDKSGLDQTLRDIRVDKIGVVALEDWKDAAVYEKVKKLMPRAVSVIVLGVEVFPEVVSYLTSRRQVGDLDLADLNERTVEIINGILDWEIFKLVKNIHQAGYEAIPLPAEGAPYDGRMVEGVLPYGLFARMAGMGSIGWHSMLLTPEFGARLRLASVLTDAPLTATVVGEEYYPCPECGGACIKVCPVAAIRRPGKGQSYQLDKYKCSNYLLASGGCSECLRVCPAGQKKGRST